ncbi:long-chain fatty acid--CoA ligase [Patescibacteria group bacterium]|nr:long-chain fatty acid--CoA ligase [Patescibacteria group bacterium]
MLNSATIFGRFEEAALLYPQNIALGWKADGSYQTISYKKLLAEVNRCVAGLKKLGIKRGDKVAIFSQNRPAWVKLDLALNKIGAITVPIHTTLSPKLISYTLSDCGADYLAIGDLFSKYLAVKDQLNLKKVITFQRIEWQEDLVYFGDLFKEEPDTSEPIESEFCTIIYTSGTTGNPKGAMLSNQNFIANIEAATEYVPYTSQDVFLSFLPLSHVLERTGGYYAVLFFGGAIYFSDRQTLAEDIKKVKPTVLVSVPRIFERVHDKVMDKVRQEPDFKQKLFFNSLKIARQYISAKNQDSFLKPIFKINYYLADKAVLRKVRNKLGGRLKYTISGGASLNPSVAKFFEALGIKILEGYGLTETSPIISVNPVNDYKFGTVGKVIPGVEVKIADDKEILVRGPSVMKGYYNNPALTQDSFTREGSFKTGDLGYLDQEGYLTIIGRKKEMIVTSTGKNINPVVLENALQESKYISQAMVVGERQKYLSALLVPDFAELKIYAQANNIKLELFELLKYQPISDLIQKEINNQLKDFPDNEQVKKFVILDKEFSEEREELTPTLKLRREKILDNYRTLI